MPNKPLEFWDARVTASGFEPSESRVPDLPKQTEFILYWHAFQAGFRIVNSETGCIEELAPFRIGPEPLLQFSPGTLPRKLAGLRRSCFAPSQFMPNNGASPAGDAELTFRWIFSAGSYQDYSAYRGLNPINDFNTRHHPRTDTEERDSLEIVSGVRSLLREARSELMTVARRSTGPGNVRREITTALAYHHDLDNHLGRIEITLGSEQEPTGARTEREYRRRFHERDAIVRAITGPPGEGQGTQTASTDEMIATDDQTSINPENEIYQGEYQDGEEDEAEEELGREIEASAVEVDSDNDVSLLGDIFGRAWARYRDAEMNRQARIQTQQTFDPYRAGSPSLVLPDTPEYHSEENELDEDENEDDEEYDEDYDDYDEEEDATGRTTAYENNPGSTRPDPKSEEELTMDAACKICYEQVTDSLILPCAHLAICRWCTSEHFGANGKCPVCRTTATHVVSYSPSGLSRPSVALGCCAVEPC